MSRSGRNRSPPWIWRCRSLSRRSFSPGSYPSLLEAYRTVGLYNLAVAHDRLPNDLVYAIIKAVFGRHDEMMAAHPAAASTIPANFTRNTFLPFHRGAVRYYQEIGVSGVAISD